ncbi:MAG: RsmD family RNA methyltransferase, partial [Bacteroidales bacterium]
DPPYNKNFIQESLNLLAYSGIITNGGLVIAEKSIKDEVPENVGDIKMFDERKYGDTVLCFYKVKSDIIV